MLDIEEICEDTRTYLRALLPACVDAVNAGRPVYGAAVPPAPASIYLGPWSRYEIYEMPALFIVAPVSNVNRLTNVADEWGHEILIAAMLEGDGVERLQIQAWRLAKALFRCLRDVDTTIEAAIAERSHKLLIGGVDWGTIYQARTGATAFRGDFTMRMTAKAFSAP